MRTDGEYIYTFTNNSFIISIAYPTNTARVISGLNLNASPQFMFLHNDRVLLYGYIYDSAAKAYKTIILILNVADRFSPYVLNQIVMNGKYFDARLTK